MKPKKLPKLKAPKVGDIIQVQPRDRRRKSKGYKITRVRVMA